MILDYKSGGLQLHDLVTKDKTMKLSWIPKLLANSEWTMFMQSFFPYPIPLMLKANIDPKKNQNTGHITPFLVSSYGILGAN